MTQNYKLLPEYNNHEQIIELNDKLSGLRGFIAIHNTTLGPALGGTRVFPYKSRGKALKDALRLSHAMTYKCAIAGLRFGGGKGVIIADPKQKDIKIILKAYAEKIAQLHGKFYTGEDVGLSEADVQYMLKFSRYFIGKSDQAGDPSPFAALSAFLCIQTALERVYGSGKIRGRSFAIKGVGKTGSELARLLYNAGGHITIADIDKEKVTKMLKKYPKMKSVSADKIQLIPCDVYSPCALGDDINPQTAKTIGAKIICGTANNQLADAKTAKALFERGIVHVPDYIANAGGLVDVSAELWKGGYSKSRVLKAIKSLKPILDEVLVMALKKRTNPDLVANAEAEKKFHKLRQKLKIALRTILSYA